MNRAVIVAVASTGMMEVTIDEVVDMIAMRQRLMPAAGAVEMSPGVAIATGRRRALPQDSRR